MRLMKTAHEPIDFSVLNEYWAQKNHGQSLTRLAERGGLSPCEAAAIIQQRPWKSMDAAEALKIIDAAIDAQREAK
jgi:hypothetical protein